MQSRHYGGAYRHERVAGRNNFRTRVLKQAVLLMNHPYLDGSSETTCLTRVTSTEYRPMPIRKATGMKN